MQKTQRRQQQTHTQMGSQVQWCWCARLNEPPSTQKKRATTAAAMIIHTAHCFIQGNKCLKFKH